MNTVGVGLRAAHYEDFLARRRDAGWLEVHSENYFGAGGYDLHVLRRLRADYPISVHGVGLALGSAAPETGAHVAKLKRLVESIEPALVSEHLCWGRGFGRHFNDLLPLPYTDEAVRHLSSRIDFVQQQLGRQILIENLSCYLSFRSSRLTEWEFLSAVVTESGCGLLLDVNNAYVNSVNVGLDARSFIERLPPGSVQEIHLAGHARRRVGERELLLDDHGSAVSEPVWELYEHAIRRHGAVPTLIEWDTDIPELSVLVGEAARAQRRLEAARGLAA
jgi:uncharacterized protein (UPF0276 family)